MHAHEKRKHYEHPPRYMEDEPVLEECLSRDANKLGEALASDNGLSDEFSDYLGEGKASLW